MSASPGEGDDVLDSGRAGGVLIRGSALRLISFALSVGLSTVAAGVLTRYLGVARFGQYTTVLSVVAVIAAVTDSGMSSYGTREYATLGEPSRSALMEVLLGLRVVLTVAGAVITVAFAAAVGYDSQLVVGAALAGLGTLPLVYQHTLSIPLSAELRLGAISALELARQVLFVAGTLTLVLLDASVLALLGTSLVANALLIAPTARLAAGRISARPALRTGQWSVVLRATALFSVASAVGTIYIYTVQILTSLVTDHLQNGLFAVSFRVFVVTANVPSFLMAAALPLLSRAARDDTKRLSYAMDRIFRIALVAGVGSALVLSAGSGFIISVIAGPQYVRAGPVLAIQSWALAATFVVASASFGLLSLHEHRRLLVANGLALVASVALTLLLAGSHGARGAAVATVGGEAVLAVATLGGLVLRGRAFWPDPAVVVKVLLATSLAVAAAYLPAFSSFVRAVVAGAVYLAGVLMLRAVPDELVELVRWRR